MRLFLNFQGYFLKTTSKDYQGRGTNTSRVRTYPLINTKMSYSLETKRIILPQKKSEVRALTRNSSIKSFSSRGTWVRYYEDEISGKYSLYTHRHKTKYMQDNYFGANTCGSVWIHPAPAFAPAWIQQKHRGKLFMCRSFWVMVRSLLLTVGLCCLRWIGFVFFTYWNLVGSLSHTVESRFGLFRLRWNIGVVFFTYGSPTVSTKDEPQAKTPQL